MIPIYKPYLEGNEKKYVNECLDSTWISSKGSFIGRFEEAVREYIGVKYSSSCSNGTVALDLAFKALDIGYGDEVITTAFTYIASTNAILINKAVPVFVDIEDSSWNIDTSKIEAKINSKTKAILISNVYGFLPDIYKLKHLCEQNNIYLIEDAAESFGTRIGAKYSGSFGDISTFSFFGNKTITTGEGGMVLTSDQRVHKKIEVLKNQGNNPNIRYHHDILGYNYRMTNIQAAIGLGQIENIDLILKKKKEIFRFYQDRLKDVATFQTSTVSDQHPSYWIIAILLKNTNSLEKIKIKLEENNIEHRPLFPPVDSMKFYQKAEDLNLTYDIFQKGLCLPSYPSLTENELSIICNIILNEN